MYYEQCPSCEANIAIRTSETVLLCPQCKEPYVPGYTVLYVCSCGGRIAPLKQTTASLSNRPTKQLERVYYKCQVCGNTIALGVVSDKP